MTNEEIVKKIAELEERRKMIEANANLEIGKCLGQIEVYRSLMTGPAEAPPVKEEANG